MTSGESGAQARNPRPMDFLRLVAFDEDDLGLISAHAQDAVLHVGDMLFQQRRRRFILAPFRFDWLNCGLRQRVQAGLHFEHVRTASLRGFRQDQPDDILNLLSIAFAPGDAPSGDILLTFSGGCEVKLAVECIEARLADLGPRWLCRHAPSHAKGSPDKGLS
jgi:hypothetical protein